VGAGTKQRVAIVEDDVDIRLALELVLGGEGWEVTTFADPCAALRALRTLSPDVICLDLRLPHMSGYELRAALLDDPALATIPVIIMTAELVVEPVVVAEILRKPFEIDDLLRALRAALPRPEGLAASAIERSTCAA
jgi:DNA-binding response OmpR family regulator